MRARFLLAASLLITFLPASSLQAASNVSISAAATSGGSFGGSNPKVFTPTAANAVANRDTIQTSLNAGVGVSILTASGAGAAGDLTVAGTVTKTAGTGAILTLNAVRDLLVNQAIFSANDVLNLSLFAGRTLVLGQPISLNGGGLTVNSGSFTPGDGTQMITVTGDLTILAAARTAVKLGDGVNGRFDVTGSVALDGALDVSFANNFEDTISAGNVFSIVTGASVTGTFAGLPDGSRVTLPNDLGSVKITYTATAVMLSDWLPVINNLTWDPGTADDGTQVFTNANPRAGRHYFRIVTEDPDIRAWRTRLTVLGGEANLYMFLGGLPLTTSYHYASERVGHDGWVRRSDQFSAGQEWFILVYATTAGSQWSLLSGRPYVQPLGLEEPRGTLKWTDTNLNGIYDIGETALASGSGVVTFKGEGMRFFRQSVPVGTPAWSLWLNGQTRDLAIRRDYVPFPTAVGGQFDRQQAGQMLVVPPYLDASTATYFLSVVGNPGETVNLDSRIQEVTPIAFGSTVAPAPFNAVDVPAAPYRVYRVQVPVQQIAWDVSTTRVLGDPNVCVRRDNVPAEFDNDAFSEVPGTVKDSITLVPNFLTDATWFITVYGTGAYRFTLTNGTPTISPIAFDLPDPEIETKTNNEPTRAGWRFYAMTDIQSQLGSLGWELNLIPGTYVAGTEIAIRRNAVPSRWRFRTGGSSNIGTTGAVDDSGLGGFLQRPGHQADIWYIGIYMPTAALGSFQLTSEKMDPPIRTFNGGTQAITGQEPGRWKYVRVDVPAGVLGWDVRLRNVTGGAPAMTVRRDQLAASSGTGPWIYPQISTTWPSGYQWGGTVDWTGHSYEAGAPDFPRVPDRLVLGMGRPLEPGTYYVGVYNSSPTQNAACVIDSRGIGAGQIYQSTDLAFSGAGSSLSISGLAPREARYFKLTMPANRPSWELTLTPSAGEALLLVRRGTVPDFGAGETGDAQGGAFEIEMQKSGPERYVMLPRSGEDFLDSGDYYIAVVGEGLAPADGVIGSGTSNATLTSLGPIAVANLGNVTTAGTSIGVSLTSAQLKAYEFIVPAGTRALEVRLKDRVGNPLMVLQPGARLPDPAYAGGSYGVDGGTYDGQFNDDDIITIAEPTAGTYRLIVRAAADNTGAFPIASATLVLRAITPTPLTFNGGTLPVTDQYPNSWQFFEVIVPSTPIGWDVRVRSVSGSGVPVMTVRRDSLPSSSGTGPWHYPQASTDWPSGVQWGGTFDWTGHPYNLGAPTFPRSPARLVMGMGRPLQQGTYIVAVHNGSATDTVSYTIDSRGIGAGLTYSVTTLTFPGGSNTITNLAPREARYFKVAILANTPSWEVTLAPTTGEVELLVRRGTVPDFASQQDGEAGVLATSGGDWEVEMQKLGPERYVMLPPDGEDFLAPGDYYLAVVSEGVNPEGGVIGTGTSSAVLTGLSPLAVTNLGGAGGAGISTPVSLVGGQIKAYEFSVPGGTASLEVQLDGRVNNPWFVLQPGTRLPSPYYAGTSWYGHDGGSAVNGIVADDNIVTIAQPAEGTYRLIVRAVEDVTGFPGASATLVIRALGPQPLDFDGGVAGAIPITDQFPNSWRYFQVTVPPGATGWDVRLREVSGAGVATMVVRRDQLPNAVGTGPWPYPEISPTWPTGYQWGGEVDWTGRYLNEVPNQRVPDRLVMGMGRPLEPGNYVVGVYNSSTTDPVSYTIDSRGIGAGFTYPITTLAFAGGSDTITDLDPREARYFKVNIPINTTRSSWEVTLDPSIGEALLLVRRGTVPDFHASELGEAGLPANSGGDFQIEMQKAGPERYVMLPPAGQATLAPGDYYLAVVSEGVNPSGGAIGTVPSTATLTSLGEIATTDIDAATVAGSSTLVTLVSAEWRAFQFSVPADTQSLEVRLDGRIGNPWVAFQPGVLLPNPVSAGGSNYGVDGGTNASGGVADDNIVTIANPAPGPYRLLVRAAPDGTGFPDASATLIVRQKPNLPLNFDASQNGNGLSHTDTRQIIDGEFVIYQVPVPAMLGAQPVLGWVLDTEVFQGAVSLQVYKDFANPNSGVSVPAATAVLVPPFLTFDETWFVRVRATGFTNYTITSRPVTLERPVWQMPVAHNVTFGDSGEATPAPGDRGVDLGEGKWHFYAIDVPVGNRGLLRTEFQAISGNPDLYIREDGVPTLDHLSGGQFGAPLYHRSLTGSTTEYGNWVPLNGRTERQLAPGRWYLGVKANGGSNVRYRLLASTGSVQELNLTNPQLAGQVLADNDWRYYRFTVPLDAPSTWSLTFSQQVGDVVMWLRDTVPPGETSVNSAGAIAGWASDAKNQGPYDNGIDPAGTHPFNTPPLRPGKTYYAGFRSNNSASFSVSSATSGGTIGVLPVIPFYAGTVSTNIPANGSLLYRIPVPAEGTRFKYTSTHDAAVQIRIEQGTLPTVAGPQHYTSFGADSSLNQQLNALFWPWVPIESYYVRFVNTTGVAQPIVFNMDGRNLLNEDEDADGLSDFWEQQKFTGLHLNGQHDLEGDGANNFIEFASNLNPNLPDAKVLVPGMGTSGLPSVRIVGTGNARHLQVEFVRRTNFPLTYRVDFSNIVGVWSPTAAVPVVTPINAEFERVVVDDTVTIVTNPRRFGRVFISSP